METYTNGRLGGLDGSSVGVDGGSESEAGAGKRQGKGRKVSEGEDRRGEASRPSETSR